ncbi:MAG TPA: helicase, partial [Armatimonadota bacterium]|nr:helicase [Armatimonadota bacterium]
MSSLLHQKAPPIEIRAELLKRVMADLLGPVGGADEEVAERSVRDRYLVGVIAPKNQDVVPEANDRLADGSRDNPEEGATDDAPPARRTPFPSSIGMTFCVDRAATELQVTANWGSYDRTSSEHLTTDAGDFQRVWKRTPRGGVSKPLPLDSRGFTFAPDPEIPEVEVRGIIRERDDHWSVTVFLVNGQEEPKSSKDSAWLFQPQLMVESPDGTPIFHRRTERRRAGNADEIAYAEERAMAMLYKRHVEFATGHGVAVHVEIADGSYDRAVRIWTQVAPNHEVPKATPPTPEDIPGLAESCLDMEELSETETSDLDAKLRPLTNAYAAWIDEQEAALGSGEMADYRDAGTQAIAQCRVAIRRINEGLDLLQRDEQAAEAFRFANRAMHLQRVRSIYSQQIRRGEQVELDDVDIPKNRSWYPFQLAFVLLNLPGITELNHPERSSDPSATADLLWFPTGGGKTEAYLGLAAYTMGLRRLQGTVAGRSGESGVAVLMRYTLRLLTLQQFQRAAALLCACEVIRKKALADDDERWGHEPFRIGLWVGRRTTPNTTEQSAQAIAKDHGQRRGGVLQGGIGSPAQLTNCPWCGTRINPGRDIKVETVKKGRGLAVISCGDPLGRCPFTPRQSGGEGLPVLVVDEEIYRRLPTMLIATVDKFAQMPWKGAVQTLFGHVDGRCSRHGFRTPEIDDAVSHPKKGGVPAARTEPCNPLRPPDLIIQDELHLISG